MADLPLTIVDAPAPDPAVDGKEHLMAALSDALLTVTVLLYLAAMIAHAAEYSFGRRPTRQAALAGVAAGGGAVGETATSASPEPARPARDWWAWARGGPLGAIAASLASWPPPSTW